MQLLVERGGKARAGEIIEDLPSVMSLTEKDRESLRTLSNPPLQFRRLIGQDITG